jgi:hypothetical protein
MADHDYCDLVIAHHKVIGQVESELVALKGGIDEIKDRLDNGVKSILERVEKRQIDRILKSAQDEEDKKNGDLSKEDTVIVRLLAMGARKALAWIFGIVFTIILVAAGMTNAFWAYFKIHGFKETPGQQQAIHGMTVNGTYHLHNLPDGKIIFHGNAPDKPAWILDPVTKQWQKCPQFRTDESIGAK